MKERPILFSAPMVRAILAGRKTQTRRIMKMTPKAAKDIAAATARGARFESEGTGRFRIETTRADFETVGQAYNAWTDDYWGKPGDRLWVRETWSAPRHGSVEARLKLIVYRATSDDMGNGWAPSIHMPRWASRITLEITGVRVERLQDISDADARAEGCPLPEGLPARINGKPGRVHDFQPRAAYCRLWGAINGADSWAANPWVWVVEFRRSV